MQMFLMDTVCTTWTWCKPLVTGTKRQLAPAMWLCASLTQGSRLTILISRATSGSTLLRFPTTALMMTATVSCPVPYRVTKLRVLLATYDRVLLGPILASQCLHAPLLALCKLIRCHLADCWSRIWYWYNHCIAAWKSAQPEVVDSNIGCNVRRMWAWFIALNTSMLLLCRLHWWCCGRLRLHQWQAGASQWWQFAWHPCGWYHWRSQERRWCTGSCPEGVPDVMQVPGCGWRRLQLWRHCVHQLLCC